MLIELNTNDYFNWKDHLKYHIILIPSGSALFSLILFLGKESHHGEAFLTFSFVYMMSCIVTTVLMTPYSIIMIIIHQIFKFQFIITLVIHVIFTTILTLIMMQSMGIAKFGGIAFGFSGIILLCMIFNNKVKKVELNNAQSKLDKK